jgi:hypothetical protein
MEINRKTLRTFLKQQWLLISDRQLRQQPPSGSYQVTTLENDIEPEVLLQRPSGHLKERTNEKTANHHNALTRRTNPERSRTTPLISSEQPQTAKPSGFYYMAPNNILDTCNYVGH